MEPFAHRVIHYQRTRGRRGLPWQRPQTLYRTWVSEIMLQQTQVATVAPYFRRFMRRFPSLRRLAEAPLDEVLAHWSGLGYYARARRLHEAARNVRGAGGRLPRTVEQWVALPGVGRSTAGAIVSLALDRPAPMLDGNARRVIARHQGLPPTADAALWRAAERLLPDREAAAYTQGLMDLGSQCCTTQAPDCARCPLNEDCRFVSHGSIKASVRKRSQRPLRATWVVIVQAECGRVLLRQREPDGIWGGLWSLPEHSSRSAARRWAQARGKDLEWREEPALTHRLSHLDLRLHPLRARILDSDCDGFCADGRWFDPRQLTVGVAAPIIQLIRSGGASQLPAPQV